MSKIVHFEIPVDDPERAQTFYRSVLGWQTSSFGDQPYWLVQAGAAGEPGADGALIARGDLHQSPVVVAGVESLDKTLDKVAESGGKVIQAKMEIPGVGWSAYIKDPEGNTIGLFEPKPMAQ